MSKGNTFETELLQHIFQNAAIANIGDAGGLQPSAAPGSLFVALHTAWPGEGGTQDTNEAAYTSYARVGVARSGAGWAVSGNNVDNVGAITFPTATGGSEEEFFASIGKASAGATVILYIVKLGTLLGCATVNDGQLAGDTITIPDHGLSVNDRVAFFATQGGALPGGVTEGTVYWVVSVPDNDTITFSLTMGGGAVDITSSGEARAFNMVGLSVSNNITPEFAAGALDVFEN